MAREGLQFELAPALRKTLSHDEEIVRNGVRVKTDNGVVCVDLQVSKIDAPEALRGLFMITFRAATKPEPVVSEETLPGGSEKHSEDVATLESELKYTKENLHSTIEELETSNEELKSTNEELQSTNEEMQSANEELETSREEMQSLNEELQTVNAELQGKIDDLSQANDDMTNLLNSTEIATIFLDDKLRIKRFTKQATEIFRLIHSDVGRPIADIVGNLEYSGLEEDARQVLTTLAFLEKELRTQHGVWYLMRVMPYRTAENVIDGLVLTFVNIDELKKAQEAAVEAHEFAESIVRTIHEPLLVLDGDMRITKASASFYKTFSVIPEETEGRCLFELGNGQWDIAQLRSLLAEILPQQTSFEGFEVDHVFPGIGRRKMLLNARRLEYGSEGKQMILLAVQDVNEKDVSPSG